MDKKFFMGIAAMAALTLVSCSSDDLNSLSDNSSKNEAISFDGYLGRSAVAVNGSRGSVLDLNALKGTDSDKKGFGVFGYYNTTDHSSSPDQSFEANLFNNEHVTCLNGAADWSYTPLKYWPAQGHIDFYAYAPFETGKTLNKKHLLHLLLILLYQKQLLTRQICCGLMLRIKQRIISQKIK